MKRLIALCTTIFALSVVVLLLVTGSKSAKTPNPGVAVKLVKGNWVVRLNIETGEEEKLHHSDKWWTHSISVSPNGRYIAFIEETQPKCNRDGAYVVAPRRNLVILDDSGKVVRRIEDRDMKKYTWGPDGEKIAFLSFKPCDCDYQYKCPTGAWVFDMNTSEIIKISDKARGINWAVFDSAVYLYDDRYRLARWDPESKELESTEYYDFNFSPDGKYYLHGPKFEEYFPIQLYRTMNNKNVLEGLPTDLGNLSGWVFNSGHFLLFTKADVIIETEGEGPVKVVKSREVQNVKNFIYDPEQKKVIKEFEGAISSWVGDGSRIIVEREGKVVFEGIP